RRHRDVVAPDDADVVGDDHAPGTEPAEQAEGDDVVVTHDRRHPRGQREVGRGVPTVEERCEVAELHQFDVCGGGRRAKAIEPFATRPRVGRAADIADATMPQCGEVVPRLAHAPGVVDGDAGDVGDL